MRSNDHKQHVHDSYENETASSSDATDTNEDTEDTDEEESNHSIAQSFDESSSENQDSVSDNNYVNATTELDHNEYIKPSASGKESYYNIFKCGRSVLDKLDVTYQRAFTASDNQHHLHHQKNHQLTGIHKKHQYHQRRIHPH